MTNEATIKAALTADYAAIDAQIKELTDTRDAIKEKLLAFAVYEEVQKKDKVVIEARIIGDIADVVFTKTFPTTFSQHLAQTLLSETDFQRCFATAVKPRITPRVEIKSKVFA